MIAGLCAFIGVFTSLISISYLSVLTGIRERERERERERFIRNNLQELEFED